MPDHSLNNVLSPEEASSLLSAIRGESDAGADALLARVGARDLRRAMANLRSIEAAASDRMPRLLPLLIGSVSASPDADMALNNLDHIVGLCDDTNALVTTWISAPASLNTVSLICASSQLLADILREVCLPFSVALAENERPPRKDRDGLVSDAIRSARESADSLRRFKRKELLRIATRDILRIASFGDLVDEISNLASACLQAALSQCFAALEPPDVRDAPDGWWREFAVLAMGKLGARELNYSSDVDLIFMYDASWSGADSPPEPVRRYFTRVGTQLIDAIGNLTTDGGLFRVDMRLRPEGGAGALVRTVQSYATYYESWGQVWERQALIKASWVAGSRDVADRFQRNVADFIWGKRLDTGGIAEIKTVKNRVEASARQSGGKRNVKMGPGCIRDIEFTVQFLQLVFGTQDETVRRRSTLGALRALGAARYLSGTEHQTLASGYVFLRTVEHQLQLMHGLGTRELPDDPDALDKFAQRLGFEPMDDMSAGELLMAEFNRHASNARALFTKLFSEMFDVRDDADIRARSLVLLAGDPTQHDLEALAEYGVKDAQRCARALRHLAHGSVTAPLPPSVAEQFADLAPSVLQAAARTPDPDASIANFGEFCGLIGSYGALYSLLADEPQVVEMLVRVAGCSASLSAILARHPEYFDMLMDPGLMEAVRSREKVTGELGVRLDDVSDSALRIQTVSRFRRRELLRVGVRDLMNGADTETTINELSVIAEACLEGLLDTVSLDAAGATGRELPFAVMGMGKLAGGELHYNSDLDVMFVWGEGGDAGPDSQRLFTRVASGVLAAAGAAAPGEGPPLTIDARLRPEGQNGPLVRSVSACAEYYANRASTWERMALIRCRAVAGSDVVGRAFVDSVAPFVWRDGLRPEELAEIIHMKGRIEQERANTADGKVDVKLGPGGIGDIEFGAQLLQLAHGHETASIRADGTLSGIRALTSAGLLESTEAESIESAYLFLRRVECRLQIVHAWDESTIEPGSGGFEALARLLEYREDGGRSAAECLAADLDAHRRASRSFWEGTVARLGG